MKIYELLETHDDYTTGVDPSFSKKVANQNKKGKKQAGDQVDKAMQGLGGNSKKASQSVNQPKFDKSPKGLDNDRTKPFENASGGATSAGNIAGATGSLGIGSEKPAIVRQFEKTTRKKTKEDASGAGGTTGGHGSAASVGIANTGPAGVGKQKKTRKK